MAAEATERGETMATRNLDESLAFVPLGFLPGDGAMDDGAADDGAEEGSGGAEFHDVEGLAAAAKGKPEKGGGGGCPAGECQSFRKECAAKVECFYDPCATVRCASGTACESNYCGGCEARCVRAKGGGPAAVSEATAEADGDGGGDAEGTSPHAKASDERDYAPPPPPPRVESPHLELKTYVDRMKLMKQISVSGGGVGDLDAANLHSKFSSEKDGVNPDRLPEVWQPPASIEMAPRAPEPEEVPDDRSSCRSVDGIYGGVSPRGGVVVRYQYEMVAKETDDAGDVVDVAGDVLPRIEGGVTDGLLPVFFEDECKGSAGSKATATADPATAEGEEEEGSATVAGAERWLRGSRRERGQRRRLNRIIGIDASPDDFVLPQRECTLDESPLAAGTKCHVVEGALTLHFPPNYSINTLIQGAQLSTLNAIRDGMFDGSLLEDVDHPAIVKLTLLEGSYSLAPILPKDPNKNEVVAIQKEPKKGGSAGLIAGVVVTLLVLCCCGGGLFFVRRRRSASKVVETDEEQGKKKKKKKRVEDESDRSGLDFIGDQLEGAGVVKGKKGKKKKKKKGAGADEPDRSGLAFIGDQLAMDGVVEEKGGKKKKKKKVAAMVRKLSRKTLKTDEEDDEDESKGSALDFIGDQLGESGISKEKKTKKKKGAGADESERSALDFIGDQLDQSITSKEKKKKKNGEGADESDRSGLDNIGDQLETDGVVSEKGGKKKKGKKVNFKKLSRKTKKEDEDGDGGESVRLDLEDIDGEEESSEQGKKKKKKKMKIKKVAPGGLAKGLSFRNMGKQGGTGEGGGARGLSFRNLGKKKNKGDEEQDQLDEESQHDEEGSVSGSEASRSFRSSQASSYLSRSILSGDDGRSARSSADDAGSARRPSDFTSRSDASQSYDSRSYDDGSVGSRSYDGSDRDSVAGGSSRRSSYSSASDAYDRDRRDWGSGSEGSDGEE